MDEYRAELASILKRVRARWRLFVIMRTWGAASTIAGMILALALLTNMFAYADGSLTVLLWAMAIPSAFTRTWDWSPRSSTSKPCTTLTAAILR